VYFDDAYMFARYAANVRHGLGVSWNLDGVHTYGETSLLWGAVALVLSYLPVDARKMLTLASWLCSVGAVIALAWAVAINAKSELLSSTWRVLPWVAVPLTWAIVFYGNQATGMETMLAVLLGAVFVGLALAWSRGVVRPELVGLVGLLLFLTRPEAAIAVVVMPVTLFVLMPGIPRRGVALVLGVFVVGVVLELIACKLYFHTALPLSFYMKSRHGYEGYAKSWHAEILMLSFLGGCQAYLIALLLLGRRKDWRMVACCVTPALATFVYLLTVTQIMGFNARYYAPYLAFLVVPALMVVDRWIAGGAPVAERWPKRMLLERAALAVMVVLFFVGMRSQRVLAAVRRTEPALYVYDPVRLNAEARVPLPETQWVPTMVDVADLLVGPLPKGATIASSEVGYLGICAPQVNIIDLEGLNDNEIALHGFNMSALLARKPDIIWMPHADYTYQRGLMLSDPDLLEQYDLYNGAANYGLAIRKGSPFRKQIDQQMQVFWSAMYPGYTMSDYLVRSASWTREKHRVID
jgi:hypothetical protein